MLAFLSNIENILVNGDQLILDRIFDKVGFNQIEDAVFRKLVQSRLSCPSSKAATVEYLKNHFDEDVDLSKIYRYLDKLNHTQQEKVQDISVHHTRKLLGGNIGVMFYDVTTLYFEADREDDLRKTGFSKEGRHKNPQIILGLLVSLNGYPLAYCIHEGNKYEGHTMMPVIEEFVSKYELDDFVIVVDSGLMNEQNILNMEKNGYKYIIGAKIKNESNVIKQWILEQKKIDRQMHEYDKIYEAYHNLWTVELAFRIAKSKIEVRPMFHFTRKRIEAHICICFVALKVYKELDRILKLNNINMSVDKVFRMAKTITTLQIRLPLNNEVISKVMIKKRHKAIERLFDENFGVMQ